MPSPREETPLLVERSPTGDKPIVRNEDDRIGSWIRRTTSSLIRQDSMLTTTNVGNDGSTRAHASEGTTLGQTIINLVKGYIGCGILSLPWALGQLGIPFGLLAILVVSLWSSYNCWTVVRVKWYIEQCNATFDARSGDNDDDDDDDDDLDTNGNGNDDETKTSNAHDDYSFATTSRNSLASSNVTYPDVGEWAYGRRFQTYVTVCICAQQLAICTVFVGFVGENVLATLRFWGMLRRNHLGKAIVTTGCLPFLMGPSCWLPTLTSMAPVMAGATVLMVSGFATLGWIALSKWDDRPLWEDLPSFAADKNAAMALCGILYSFEGICIILPIESSMRKGPGNEFGPAFAISMGIVTMLLCGMAAVGVLAFGTVTNGSITAFLLERYPDDPRLAVWVMLSNTLVTASIAVSYPLQLYPAVELVAPAVGEWIERRKTQTQTRTPCGWLDGWFRGANTGRTTQPSSDSNSDGNDNDNDKDRSGLKGIPEHRALSVRSLSSPCEAEVEAESKSESGFEMGRNPTGEDPSVKGATTIAASNRAGLPGDSPALRAGLVVGTYLVAMSVPNVHNLVALVGAVTGSSTALLIPPILELAYLRRREEDEQRSSSNSNNSNNNSRINIRNATSIARNRLLAWGLLVLGSIFALVGSYFSVLDILESYST